MTLWHSAGSVAKLLGMSAPTGLWDGEPGTDKVVAWGDPGPLEVVSGLARRTGTTVNDVCVALVAGAFDGYLAHCRAEGKTGGCLREVALMLPVSLEPFDADLPETLGNHFSLVLANLPLGRRGFHERLGAVHRRVARIRDSYEPVLTFGLQQLAGQLPPAFSEGLTRYFADKAVGVLTNVPGPRTPMTLAGARVAGIIGWAPCSGRQAITVCVFSYAGQVFFGFGTDRKLIPDPGRLVTALDAEIDQVKALL